MTLIVGWLAFLASLSIGFGVFALRKPIREPPPPPREETHRRPCAGAREAVLRGFAVALVLLPFAIVSIRGAAQAVGGLVLVAILCGSVVLAGLLEHAAARRDQAEVALMIGSLTALCAPLAVLQGVYAAAVVVGGIEHAWSAVTELLTAPGATILLLVVSAGAWGVPCALSAFHRIERNGNALCLVLLAIPSSAGAPIPGLIVLELAYRGAAWLEARVTGDGDE